NWQALRQTYYIVKDLDHIDYDLRVELCEVLRKKGTSGVHPPRQYHYKSKEERIKNAGQEGEKQLTYALKWLDKNKFKVFNNIKLSDGGEAQEFDSIVIGDKAVFNIETKNYIGDLVIDEQGNWYRLVNGHKFGTENPIFQVKRHNRVLNNILGGGVPIVDLVVWSNLESIIEGAHYSPVKVIKLDQLTYFIESFNEGRNLTREEINLIIKRIEDSCSDYMANRS
ncbi:MAG TPA: nuclease-related domain-containing protein, partial [Defluviitaleaceae bacterium]|nr:nuclease-related domain-containing protein [Defluviitaleaceae bacterium]